MLGAYVNLFMANGTVVCKYTCTYVRTYMYAHMYIRMLHRLNFIKELHVYSYT